MCRCRCPVVCVRNCEFYSLSASHIGGDEHSLVSREHSLAVCDSLAALVLSVYGSGPLVAVGLVWEWLLDLATAVAFKATVLGLLV